MRFFRLSKFILVCVTYVILRLIFLGYDITKDFEPYMKELQVRLQRVDSFAHFANNYLLIFACL